MKLNSYTLGYAVAGAGWFIAGMALFGKFVIPYLSHGDLLALGIVLTFSAAVLSAFTAVLYIHVGKDNEIP
jgi:hypothetical protein